MDASQQDSARIPTEERSLSTPAVILLGGLVGGGLGAVVSSVLQRRGDEAGSKEIGPVRVRTQTQDGDVHVVVEDAQKQLDAVATALKRAEETLSRASERGTQLSSRSRQDLERAVNELETSLRGLQERMAASSGEQGRQFAKTVQPLIEQARAMSKRFAPAVATTTERVRETVEHLPEIAGETVERGRQQAAELAPELQEAARKRVGAASRTSEELAADLTKAARELTGLTRTQTAQLAEAVRSRFPGLRDQIEHTLAELGTVGAVRGGDQRRNLVEDLTHQLEQVRDWLQSEGEQVAKTLEESVEETQEAAERLREASRRAAVQTTTATRDALGTIGWATLAGAIVYYGLLNDPQRARVRSFGQEVWRNAREVVQDLRGADAQF